MSSRTAPKLKVVLPPPDHEPSWRRLQNIVYGAGAEDLFAWLRDEVRPVVEEREREKRRVA